MEILLIWVLAVVEFREAPAIIVTVFSADHQPVWDAHYDRSRVRR